MIKKKMENYLIEAFNKNPFVLQLREKIKKQNPDGKIDIASFMLNNIK